MQVYDYDIDQTKIYCSVIVDGKETMFQFSASTYDAVMTGIELGFILEPDDSDKTRIGYEHPAFSPVVREDTGTYRMQYYSHYELLKELSGAEKEAIVLVLAAQQHEIHI